MTTEPTKAGIPATPTTLPGHGFDDAALRVMVRTLLPIALWIVGAMVMIVVAERGFGMDELSARAYGIGVVSYIAALIGFMWGLVLLVQKDR